jgi:hypothetical protein
MNEILNNLYYKEYNFDGANSLYEKAKKINPKITMTNVREWLKKQSTSQVFYKKVGKKEFLPIYSEAPHSFQIDLTFFPRYKKQNDGNTVLFTAINVNTRFVYAYYSKTKDMSTILDMLIKMEKKTPINIISCDEGKEFNNRDFLKFCKENDIQTYFIKSDSHKLGIINRFHRTLKEKLAKFFIASNTVRWVEVIDKIIDNYNRTINSGIGVAPIDANDFIEHDFVVKAREKTERIRRGQPDFQVGDKVRILNKKALFEDKMLPRFSSTVFTIIKVNKNTCQVKDEGGNEILVKMTQLLKVNETQDAVPIDAIKEASAINSKERKLKRAGVNDEDILLSKRDRKKNQKYID